MTYTKLYNELIDYIRIMWLLVVYLGSIINIIIDIRKLKNELDKLDVLLLLQRIRK